MMVPCIAIPFIWFSMFISSSIMMTRTIWSHDTFLSVFIPYRIIETLTSASCLQFETGKVNWLTSLLTLITVRYPDLITRTLYFLVTLWLVQSTVKSSSNASTKKSLNQSIKILIYKWLYTVHIMKNFLIHFYSQKGKIQDNIPFITTIFIFVQNVTSWIAVPLELTRAFSNWYTSIVIVQYSTIWTVTTRYTLTFTVFWFKPQITTWPVTGVSAFLINMPRNTLNS